MCGCSSGKLAGGNFRQNVTKGSPIGDAEMVLVRYLGGIGGQQMVNPSVAVRMKYKITTYGYHSHGSQFEVAKEDLEARPKEFEAVEQKGLVVEEKIADRNPQSSSVSSDFAQKAKKTTVGRKV